MNWLLSFLIFWSSAIAFAQADDDATIEVEALYDEHDKNEEVRRQKEKVKTVEQKIEKDEVGTLAELSILSPFDDVAVIQRRFFPKTSRFEFNGGLISSLNNAFFSNWGLAARTAYYFSEKYGLEFMFLWLNSSEREVTESLRDKQSVSTRSLVVPENYMGLSFKWVPVYGKIALFNRRVIPFDLYFSGGGGLSETGLENKEPTLHLGTGQKFFLTKSTSFRWDFALNMYQAEILESSGSGALQSKDKNHFDLFISLGLSYYWPEASYR